MSIDRCAQCDALIDTDVYPEVYREEFGGECICNDCWIEPDEFDVAAGKADLANDLEKCYPRDGS